MPLSLCDIGRALNAFYRGESAAGSFLLGRRPTRYRSLSALL